MNEIKLTVHPFLMGDVKEAALKPLEESAEIYGAWQRLGETAWGHLEQIIKGNASISLEKRLKLGVFADEIADCITACVNLADRYGIDLQDAIDRVEQRNLTRGRYTDE